MCAAERKSIWNIYCVYIHIHSGTWYVDAHAYTCPPACVLSVYRCLCIERHTYVEMQILLLFSLCYACLRQPELCSPPPVPHPPQAGGPEGGAVPQDNGSRRQREQTAGKLCPNMLPWKRRGNFRRCNAWMAHFAEKKRSKVKIP